jgi:hypothetical protein
MESHILKSEQKKKQVKDKKRRCFIYLFSPLQPNIGNIREIFFYNQVQAVHQITAPKYGDFMIDDQYVFEVGGANKSMEQIKGVPDAYLALDIEQGSNRSIPLWLFGMMY